MKKGLLIFSVINLSISVSMFLMGAIFSSPVNMFFYIVSALLIIPTLTLIFKFRAFIRFASVVLFVTCLITGIMVLYSISGFLYFDKSWATHLVQAILYAFLTFYLLGFSGYLKEFIRNEDPAGSA
jgi:FlaA1/EpsC-like NDP-sugar epimerase